MKHPKLFIQCTSEKYGAVQFDIVGTIATQVDRNGEYFSPTRTFNDSMEWVFDSINRMRQECPDFRFLD